MRDQSNIDQFTRSFSPVSLEELNTKAEMMARIDNKYVVQSDDLLSLVPDLSEGFDILDIEDQRAFTYDARYFDDVPKSAYLNTIKADGVGSRSAYAITWMRGYAFSK